MTVADFITDTRTQRALEALGVWQVAADKPGWPRQEAKIPCPVHGGKNDNFKLEPDGRWYCHSKCGDGGGVLALIERMRSCSLDEAKAFYLGEDASAPSARISTRSLSKRIPQAAPATPKASSRGTRPRDMRPAAYEYTLLRDLVPGEHAATPVRKKISRQWQNGRAKPDKRISWEFKLEDGTWKTSISGSQENRQAFGQDRMPPRYWYTKPLERYARIQHTEDGDVSVALHGKDGPPEDCRLWVVEGEECASLLADAGLCTTTGANGAETFKDGVPEPLAALLGKWQVGIVILPDNDAPGAGYARAVAKAARTAGATVKIVSLPGLPEKGDVLDWAWEAGYLPDEGYRPGGQGLDSEGIRKALLEAAANTDVWEDLPEPEPEAPAEDWEEMTGEEIQALPDAPMPVLFQDAKGDTVIPAGLLLLGGAPKMGKTWAALDLAISFATGRKAFGLLRPASGHEDEVLYINCDLQDLGATLKPRISLLADGRPVPRLRVVTPTPEQKDYALVARVLRMVKSNPRIRFVIVDTITGARSGEVGRRGGNLQSQEMNQTAAWREVQREGVAVLLVCHTRKGLSVDPLEAIAGTNGMTGSTDEVMTLTGTRGGAGQIFMAGRTCADRTLLLEKCKTGNWRATEIAPGTGGAGTTEQRAAVLDIARINPDGKVRPADLVEDMDMSPDRARATLKRMAKDGQLQRCGRGIYGLPSEPAKTPSGTD